MCPSPQFEVDVVVDINHRFGINRDLGDGKLAEQVHRGSPALGDRPLDCGECRQVPPRHQRLTAIGPRDSDVNTSTGARSGHDLEYRRIDPWQVTGDHDNIGTDLAERGRYASERTLPRPAIWKYFAGELSEFRRVAPDQTDASTGCDGGENRLDEATATDVDERLTSTDSTPCASGEHHGVKGA